MKTRIDIEDVINMIRIKENIDKVDVKTAEYYFDNEKIELPFPYERVLRETCLSTSEIAKFIAKQFFEGYL